MAFVAPLASAQPCNTMGTCCGLTLCQCTLCRIPPITTIACTTTVGDVYASATVAICPGGVSSVSVCTQPRILTPVDPKSPPTLAGCNVETTVVLP